MKKLPAFLFLLLAVLMVVPSDLHAAKKRRDVKGTIFKDPNGNNKLDNKEKGGESATVWLYRVQPNGKKRRVGKVATDQAGNYQFNKVRTGKYFIAVRYNSNKLAVRTRTFTIGGGSNAFNANVPFVTPATIKKYPNLTSTPNPDNLAENPTTPGTTDGNGGNAVTPFTP